MLLEKYKEQQALLPHTGKHIIGQADENSIIVYQAFNANIAKYAIANQQFGGNHYSFNRMTWIKPNFMWMMYRAGWATKENQERILAIKIKKEGFKTIFDQAVYSSYRSEIYESQEAWRAALAASPVRLQWDPDHNPTGQKLERKAIQLGMKGQILHDFNKKWIISIEDITSFVIEQRPNAKGKFEELLVPTERIIIFD